jgi:hypothetical protein
MRTVMDLKFLSSPARRKQAYDITMQNVSLSAISNNGTAEI